MSTSSAGLVVPFTDAAAASPLLWLVNICWGSCGFCQALDNDWHRLARRLKHEAVVSYYDAGVQLELPSMLGHANVTPTIRAIVPVVPDPDAVEANDAAASSSSSSSSPPFKLVDYHGDRSFADLHRFALGLMPNHVVRALTSDAFHGALSAFPTLPKVLCFLGIDPALETPPLLRALSAIYRGRVLVIEVRVHETAPDGARLAARYGVDRLPSFMALRVGGQDHDHDEPFRYNGPPITFRRLSEFAAALLQQAAS